MRFNKLTHLWIFFFTNDSVYSFQKVLTSHISEQPYYYKEIIDFLLGFRRRRLKARPRPQQGDTVGGRTLQIWDPVNTNFYKAGTQQNQDWTSLFRWNELTIHFDVILTVCRKFQHFQYDFAVILKFKLGMY